MKPVLLSFITQISLLRTCGHMGHYKLRCVSRAQEPKTFLKSSWTTGCGSPNPSSWCVVLCLKISGVRYHPGPWSLSSLTPCPYSTALYPFRLCSPTQGTRGSRDTHNCQGCAHSQCGSALSLSSLHLGRARSASSPLREPCSQRDSPLLL